MTSIQPSLFDDAPLKDKVEESPQVDGLVYVSDFITEAEESGLLAIIDQQPWINDLKRRVSKELKGTGITIEIKKYFYGKLPDNEFNIYSVTLNKVRVQDHLKTKDGKKRLYNYLAKFIIQRTPLHKIKDDNVNFIVDRCKNKEGIKDFNQYIENEIGGSLPSATKLYITHESSEENLCLQAVDLFCWGIFRKHTNNDTEWYSCFEGKIKYDKKYLP